MVIRFATEQDLQSIADIHKLCFQESFSSLLWGKGKRSLLYLYYKVFLDAYPTLFLVSEENGSIDGFCIGYLLGEENLTKRFIKNNALRLGFRFIGLLLCGNRIAWNKIKHTMKKEPGVEYVDSDLESIKPEKRVDLLSICVLPDKRGRGIADSLIDSYEAQGSLLGRGYCVLSVHNENARAIRFYEKHGYVMQRKTGESTLLIKKIIGEQQ